MKNIAEFKVSMYKLHAFKCMHIFMYLKVFMCLRVSWVKPILKEITVQNNSELLDG